MYAQTTVQKSSNQQCKHQNNFSKVKNRLFLCQIQVDLFILKTKSILIFIFQHKSPLEHQPVFAKKRIVAKIDRIHANLRVLQRKQAFYIACYGNWRGIGSKNECIYSVCVQTRRNQQWLA
jgi:hypothetical protein